MKYANHTYYKHVRRYVHMCMEMYLDVGGSLRKVVLSEEYHIGFQCQGYTKCLRSVLGLDFEPQ